MSKKKKNNDPSKLSQLIERLKLKKRVVIINESTFEEQSHYTVTPLNILTISLFSFFVLIALVYLLIAYTPIKHTIPGYPDSSEQQNIKQLEINNAKYLDDEEHRLEVEKLYYNNLLSILNDEEPIDPTVSTDTNIQVNDTNTNQLSFDKSIEDSLLREEIDQREKYQLNFNHEDKSSNSDDALKGVYFFTPLRGTITNEVDVNSGHFGVDIAAEKDEAVKAVLDGEIIFSDWSPEQGHIVIIQHKHNIISVYKHNSFLLKKTGDFVKAGDAVAIVGSSGATSTGTHLHFELWYNGVCLDPLIFISF